MAIDMSKQWIQEQRIPKRLFLMVRFWPYVNKWRILLRKLFPTRRPSEVVDFSASGRPIVSDQLERDARLYQEEGWTFIKDMIDPDLHRKMVASWPGKRYMTPPSRMTKSYNFGLRWNLGKPKAIENVERFPYFQQFFDYVSSDAFAARVASVCQIEDPVLDSFWIAETETGSHLPPHRDSTFLHPRKKEIVNFLFFINGAGGHNSGGTTLSNDDEMKDIVFEPLDLVNTCLVYNIGFDFYHGFDPVAPGKFRWVISAEFIPRGYDANQVDLDEDARRRLNDPKFAMYA